MAESWFVNLEFGPVLDPVPSLPKPKRDVCRWWVLLYMEA